MALISASSKARRSPKTSFSAWPRVLIVAAKLSMSGITSFVTDRCAPCHPSGSARFLVASVAGERDNIATPRVGLALLGQVSAWTIQAMEAQEPAHNLGSQVINQPKNNLIHLAPCWGEIRKPSCQSRDDDRKSR